MTAPEINPNVAAVLDDIIAIRRDIHSHPELGFEEHRTAEIAARKLREFGCDEVVEGIGKTGVVAIIKGCQPDNGKTVALRADMDALPLIEKSGEPWASVINGKMHGCGHDGHVATALAVAAALCADRDFAGSVMIIIQPGEEGYAGAKAMIEDGLFTRWNVDEVYAGHGGSDTDLGAFGITDGAMMAAADCFEIIVKGKGGHGGRPNLCIDPVVIASQLVVNMQTIVSRSVDPQHPAVVTFASIQGGDGEGASVVPDSVRLVGTTRSMYEADRDMIERRMNEICDGMSTVSGATIKLNYDRRYPVLVNHHEQVLAMAEAVRECAGEDKIDLKYPASMGAEDFSFMLNEKPGCYMRVGLRDERHTAFTHNPAFDFNDKAIGLAATVFVRLFKTRLAYLAK